MSSYPTPEYSTQKGLLPLARVRVEGTTFVQSGTVEYDVVSWELLKNMCESGAHLPSQIPEPQWVRAPHGAVLANSYGMLAVKNHNELITRILAAEDPRSFAYSAQNIVLKGPLPRLQKVWAHFAGDREAQRRRDVLGGTPMYRLAHAYLGLHCEELCANQVPLADCLLQPQNKLILMTLGSTIIDTVD